MKNVEIVVEWDTAQVSDSVEPSQDFVGFDPPSFLQTIKDGHIIGWLLVDEVFFEDFDLPEYEGEDVQLDSVEVRFIDPVSTSLSIRAVLNIRLDSTISLETEVQRNQVYNALTGGIQLFYWTGEGSSPHPEKASGIFTLTGEINFVSMNGFVLHERRKSTDSNIF